MWGWVEFPSSSSPPARKRTSGNSRKRSGRRAILKNHMIQKNFSEPLPAVWDKLPQSFQTNDRPHHEPSQCRPTTPKEATVKTVLIVEDDEKIAASLQIRFQANGFSTLLAHDALQATRLG